MGWHSVVCRYFYFRFLPREGEEEKKGKKGEVIEGQILPCFPLVRTKRGGRK